MYIRLASFDVFSFNVICSHDPNHVSSLIRQFNLVTRQQRYCAIQHKNTTTKKKQSSRVCVCLLFYKFLMNKRIRTVALTNGKTTTENKKRIEIVKRTRIDNVQWMDGWLDGWMHGIGGICESND